MTKKRNGNLLLEMATSLNYNRGYSINEVTRDVAEAALQEWKEGYVNVIGLRDTTDKYKEIVFDWLKTDEDSRKVWVKE